jgi:hypothetical protein
MPVRHPLVPVSHVLEESFIRTNYNNKVDEIISRGLPKDVMINNLALLPLEELKQSMKNHPYYIPKAIERKEELNRQKNLVPVEKIISALKNTGKKTNSAYKYTVSKNKKYHIKPWENKKWEN